jgi:hypothetical protein
VLDPQKRPRLVSCGLSPEWVYFCFLSNFYFDVYDDVSQGQVLVWLSDIARGGLYFCAVKDSARVCGSCSVWRTCGDTGVFLFVYLFVFLGIDFSRIYHISMLDWPPDTGLDAVFLGKRFQTHDTYKHNHSLFSTLIYVLSSLTLCFVPLSSQPLSAQLSCFFGTEWAGC